MIFSQHFKSVIYVIVSGILFGLIGYLGLEIFKHHISVELMLFWRFIIATIFLMITSKEYNILTLPKVPLLIGIFLYAPSTYLWFYSLKLIDSGLSMVIFYSFPIYVTLCSWMSGKSKPKMISMIAIVIMMIGLFLIAEIRSFKVNNLGIMISLASAVMYGIYFFVIKSLCKNISADKTSIMICLGNAIVFGTAVVLSKNTFLIGDLSVWINIIVIGIFGTSLPILFLSLGIKYVSEIEAAILSVSEPVVSLIIGVMFLHEHINNIQTIGVILIILSAIIIQIKKFQIRF